MTLEILREIHNQMNTGTALVFLYIANQPDISIAEIERYSEMSHSACSRHVLVLTERGDAARGQAGLGLVETYADHADLRVKRCKLTEKGKAIAARVSKALTI